MAKAAQNQELKAAFEKHHGETEEQIERLEQVFAEINHKPQGKSCAAIEGITEEGAEIMKDIKYLLPGCRPPRRGTSGRALRNIPVWNVRRLGRKLGLQNSPGAYWEKPLRKRKPRTRGGDRDRGHGGQRRSRGRKGCVNPIRFTREALFWRCAQILAVTVARSVLRHPRGIARMLANLRYNVSLWLKEKTGITAGCPRFWMP